MSLTTEDQGTDVQHNALNGRSRRKVYQAINGVCLGFPPSIVGLPPRTPGYDVPLYQQWDVIAVSEHISAATISHLSLPLGNKWNSKLAAVYAADKLGFPVTCHNVRTAIKEEDIIVYHAPGAPKKPSKGKRIRELEHDFINTVELLARQEQDIIRQGHDLIAVMAYLTHTDSDWRDKQ